MKYYDGHNFPSHWELIRPLEQSSPHNKAISFRRSWNFDKSEWNIQVWGSHSHRHSTIGTIKNMGYTEGRPLFRHSFQDTNDIRYFQKIEDCERDLLDHYMLIEGL